VKTILLLAATLLAPLALVAQGRPGDPPPGDDRWREFEVQKVAFFTRQMSLTPDEAARFWPLYNEMQAKIKNAVEPTWRSRENPADLTERQAAERLDALLVAEESAVKLRAEYYRRITDAISARKLWLMLDAERDFHRQLVKRLGRDPGGDKR
jgi:hypothetical protein